MSVVDDYWQINLDQLYHRVHPQIDGCHIGTVGRDKQVERESWAISAPNQETHRIPRFIHPPRSQFVFIGVLNNDVNCQITLGRDQAVLGVEPGTRKKVYPTESLYWVSSGNLVRALQKFDCLRAFRRSCWQ